MYKNFFKRIFDIVLSGIALIVLSPVFLILAVLVRAKLGAPVIFKQKRPGRIDKKTGQEKIFTLYKFRSMTDKRDEKGNLLPDHDRLTSFGKLLRSTSLDELPEIWNIFKGDMSIIGPRPQLVKDMVFMSDEIRKRHSVRPGLTGLAQVKGRNGINWEQRFKYDLEYVEKISFVLDLRIFITTIFSVLKREGISEEGCDTSTDYGDWLLHNGNIDSIEFRRQILKANEIISKNL